MIAGPKPAMLKFAGGLLAGGSLVPGCDGHARIGRFLPDLAGGIGLATAAAGIFGRRAGGRS
jgi:hypothetical protein